MFICLTDTADVVSDDPQILHKKSKKKKSKKKKHRKRESSSDESGEEKRERENSDSEIGPPVPLAFKPAVTAEIYAKTSQINNDEDEDNIGPPLPPGYTKPNVTTERDLEKNIVSSNKMKTSVSDDAENDEDDEDDTAEADDVSLFFLSATSFDTGIFF